MANFKYPVRDRSGKVVGVIEAPSVEIAGERLYPPGYLPIQIEEKTEAIPLNLSDLRQRFQKIDMEEILFFSQQHVLLRLSDRPFWNWPFFRHGGILRLYFDDCPLPNAPPSWCMALHRAGPWCRASSLIPKGKRRAEQTGAG